MLEEVFSGDVNVSVIPAPQSESAEVVDAGVAGYDDGTNDAVDEYIDDPDEDSEG